MQQLKDALVTEQSHAIEVADRAIDAFDKLLNLSMWTFGILGFVVALIAIFGYGLIASSARKAAERVATDRIDSYIKSQEFTDNLEKLVHTEVRRRLANKVILANLQEEPDTGEADPFPEPPSDKK